MVWTIEGAKLGICKTSGRHGVRPECGVLLYQSWVGDGSFIFGTLAREAHCMYARSRPRDWMDGLLSPRAPTHQSQHWMAVAARPFSPYPKGRCNSTQCCHLNHTRRRQNPVTLIDCKGTEQLKGTASGVLYIRVVPAEEVRVGLCH